MLQQDSDRGQTIFNTTPELKDVRTEFPQAQVQLTIVTNRHTFESFFLIQLKMILILTTPLTAKNTSKNAYRRRQKNVNYAKSNEVGVRSVYIVLSRPLLR